MTAQSPPGGSIIGISSISALVGGAFQAHYTPTKAGVTSLMQSAACALGKHNIRCNALLPGTIKTKLNEKDLEDEQKKKYMEGRIPLGRTGVPADLAGPAVFLGSELSGYVSGAQLLVDGGLFVNLQWAVTGNAYGDAIRFDRGRRNVSALYSCKALVNQQASKNKSKNSNG